MQSSMKTIIAIMTIAATVCVAACKNSSTSGKQNGGKDNPQPSVLIAEANTPEPKTIDVVYMANLYCKVTDMDKASIFLGKKTDSLFTVEKDVENNYAAVYAQTQYENSLKFYMWTDKDGEKILGVNLTESGERGHNKRSLQFFTYDANVDLVVPCKRLNEVITNKVMSMRRNLSLFVFRIPTSPEDENITMGYWEKKDKEKYKELVFVWDGHTFNVN